MGHKNRFSREIQEIITYYREAEHFTQIQFMRDLFSTVLNDPAVMGKDVLGEKRLTRVLKAVDDAYVFFTPALETAKKDEADYYQELMDRKLKPIYKHQHFFPFRERYIYLKPPK